MPVYLQKELKNGNRIAVWEITETADELLSMVSLSSRDEQKLASFRLDSRKREWLAVRVLVKKMLGENREIFYKSSGAPFFKDQEMQIGISHTKGFAGVALAPFRTSLDMEKASPKIERVCRRFVNEAEKQYIPHENRIEYYNLIWCAKETLFKLLDRRDVVFKENLNIKPLVMEKKGTIIADVMFPDLKSEVTLGYEVTPGFTLVYYINHTGNDI